ncbi:EamA family transporter RarD [Maritimibacter dapengensis]|uniref:EamA family transporter RarD n=1 Tax=Maritimibacter dapengensis TaxID=2836868 RepID=A0ABS6T1U2_9RHOB|nr:EamA family transporter RarD [Maritimibacter dapengensis]MBV7379221.1 EamA family transporter RarD [Maritimibacter dapengensis]
MSETGKGIIALIGAGLIWGLAPILYKALAHVPAFEVLAHRTLWSFVFFACILLAQRRIATLGALLTGPNFRKVAFAAAMISANWFFFIFSIQTNRALGASLGYYIFPLVAVLLGLVLFRESLGRARGVAVGLAALAVLILTVGLGAPPWISLLLAFTFGLYGAIKKGLDAGPIASVTAEVALVAPVSLGYFVWLYTGGDESGMTGGTDFALLLFSGVLTGAPLIFFSYGARRLSYGLTGVMQYINPSIQFLIAAFIFLEPVTHAHLVALPLIWVALAIYSTATLRQERAASKRLANAGTSGTTVR